jgi:hypothetical protein
MIRDPTPLSCLVVRILGRNRAIRIEFLRPAPVDSSASSCAVAVLLILEAVQVVEGGHKHWRHMG